MFFRLIHQKEINDHLQYNREDILLDLVTDIRKQLQVQLTQENKEIFSQKEQ